MVNAKSGKSALRRKLLRDFTNGSNTRSVAGKVFDVDADGVWVDFR